MTYRASLDISASEHGTDVMRIFYRCLFAFVATFGIGMLFLFVTAPTENRKGKNDMSEIAGMSGINVQETFPIEVPASWRIDADSGKESGGWRQTGHAPGRLDDVMVEVGELMSAHGFRETRLVDSDELGKPGRLIQYESSRGIQVMWMLWKAGEMKTGFSWGRER